MGVYLARLPSAYQEVERIRSNGSQYFDTGFYPTGNSEIEIDFVRESGSNVGTFGVDSGWTRNAFSILNDRIFCYGSQYQSQDQNYYTIGTRYLMKFKNLTCTLNGVTKFTYSSNSFTSSYSAYMFAKRRNNYIEVYSSITCYSLKLWDNGTLARDYVPCYRKSDGVIGMYDLVNNTFNTNQGSGTFTKGADVFQGELKNAYIGEYVNFATQGPAPDGFHVPLNTEWQSVYDIWTALGGGSSDGTNFGIALKLPFAGYRNSSSAGVSYQGTYGSYWSSSRYNASNAYFLNFYSTALSPQDASNRAYGFSVRCFKNSPTVPTSSWTKLYGTSIESGGIFWSSADGLISLSSNGTTWITIMDKNLGATTVWNSGNTLSEANCGKYYQWGNNYGFPFTGSVTTSGTQVDASNYGPGNYYSSSTFITRSSSPYRWDTTDNANLRGGVDGNIPV